MSGGIIDIQNKLNAKKMMMGNSFIYCAACMDEEAGFAAMGAFNAKGEYFLKALICLSSKCMGRTEIPIQNGFVK